MREIKFKIPMPELFFREGQARKIKVIISALILVIVFLVARQFEFTWVGAFILAYFGLTLLWKLSSRIAASLALLFLVVTPILLILENDELAETFAIYAYYFLVITVAQAIVEMRKE